MVDDSDGHPPILDNTSLFYIDKQFVLRKKLIYKKTTFRQAIDNPDLMTGTEIGPAFSRFSAKFQPLSRFKRECIAAKGSLIAYLYNSSILGLKLCARRSL